MITNQGLLYPNQYIWLVAAPGVGKSNPVKAIRGLLEQLGGDELYIAPTNVTSASLMDFMEDAQRNIVRFPGPTQNYQPGILIADEISAFMPVYDAQMIGLLTTMYDADVKFSESRRTTGKTIVLTRPMLNMIVGTTPSNLLKYLPEYAWDQGFTSRIIFIYSTRGPNTRDRFEVTIKRDDDLLLHDLECINRLEGEFKIGEEFKGKVKAWQHSGHAPEPTHKRLEHYNTRRWAHLMKLAMVSSADRGDDQRLTVEDYDRASKWLFEAEAKIPQIFDKGIASPDAALQEELVYFIKNFNGATIREDQLNRKARTILPIHAVQATIDVFVKAGILTVVHVDKFGQRVFKHD